MTYDPSGYTKYYITTGTTTETSDKVYISPSTTGSSLSTTYSYSNNYSVTASYGFTLPIKGKLPKKIYLNGQLQTMGPLWSSAQIKIIKANKINIPVEWQITKAQYLSVEYKDWIYHYEIADKNGIIKSKAGDLTPSLLSQVEQ